MSIYIFIIKFILIISNIKIIIYQKIDKIRIAIYTYGLKGGGIERVTALLLKYLSIEKMFHLYVFTQRGFEENEYIIPTNIDRVNIDRKKSILILKRKLKVMKIDILIYQFPHGDEIKIINTLEKVKIIIYSHFCFLTWIYFYETHYFSILYESYKESKYIVSLVEFENNYIFKKWGINSILMNNLVSYEYNKVTPSDLSHKTILMIGRASDRFKRFELGIQAMQYISKVVKGSKLKIISNSKKISKLKKLIKELELKGKVIFIGDVSNMEEFLQTPSLHIFPTVSEAFPMALCETKVFGIPNILTGLDFVAMSKKGTVIIYDDNLESIARESIKILIKYKYRKTLGKNARESMKRYKNKETIKQWIKLILAVYKGDEYYNKFRAEHEKISLQNYQETALRQVKLINLREQFLGNLTIDILLNFSHIKNY